MRSLFYIFIFAYFLISCSTDSSKSSEMLGPDWIHQPVRIVDNGYIVYVDSDAGPNLEKAKFKAEGLALSDLANECSFIPKGTRIEDRCTQPGQYGPTTYIKIAVEFQECSSAQKANDPESIRKIANQSFMQQLKAYQDFVETGEIADRSVPMDVDISQPPPAPPTPSVSQGSDNIHFYVLRQYVVYQKEVVILSSSSAFTPHSVETHNFVANMTPTVHQLQTMQEAQPNLATKPMVWSKIVDRPRLDRPSSLRPKLHRAHQLALPRMPRSNPGHKSSKNKNTSGSRHRGKKRHQQENENQSGF